MEVGFNPDNEEKEKEDKYQLCLFDDL